MRIIFYIIWFCFAFTFVNALHRKNRYDDYEQSDKEEEFDFNELRSKAKKFNIDTPDGHYKLVAELKKAHGRNLQLQSYISDLLDIWIFRTAIKDAKQSPNLNSDSKKELVEISPASQSKEAEKLREGVKKATNMATNKRPPTTADPVAHVLHLIAAIKTQATLVLKRATELETEILSGTENTKKMFRHAGKTVAAPSKDLDAAAYNHIGLGDNRPYPYSWINSLVNATNKLLGTPQAHAHNENNLAGKKSLVN